MQLGISMAGRSPCALRHEALLFSCRLSTPALPVPPRPPRLQGGLQSSFAQAAVAVRREEWRPWVSVDSWHPNAFRSSATTVIHHLPFQEGPMPAHRLMMGLAEQTPCLHRLAGKKKALGPPLKRLHHNPPPEQNSLYITPEKRKAGSPGDPASARKAGEGFTRSSRGEEGPVHIKGSDPGS